MGLLHRQIALAGLNANAIRPARGMRSGVGAFAAGWLTTELAPHLLGLAALDAATHLRPRTRGDFVGLALAGANAAVLGALIAQGHGARRGTEQALIEALGADYAQRLDAAVTPADLAVPWRALLNPFRIRTPGVQVERNISYGDAGRRSMLDIYRSTAPDSTQSREGAPVLVQIHGGAWVTGSKEHQAVPLMQHMAAKGWICVAINYRLAGRDPWPAQIIDVKRALAWVHEHIAEYGGDPGYIALTGGSAGGHLTALAALTGNDPQFQPGFEAADTSVDVAVPHYGVYDFAGTTGLPRAVRMRDAFLAPKVFGRPFDAGSRADFEAASPLLRIGPDAPDFFVLHGTADSLVDVEQARAFVEALSEQSSASVVYAELPGAHHAFDTIPSIRSAHVLRAIDRYLQWHRNGWRRQRASLATRTIPGAEV